MDRKDACDLTAIFGFLATIVQVWNIYELSKLPMSVEITYGNTTEYHGTNTILLIVQQTMILIFFVCITYMAWKLRTPQTEQPKQETNPRLTLKQRYEKQKQRELQNRI